MFSFEKNKTGVINGHLGAAPAEHGGEMVVDNSHPFFFSVPSARAKLLVDTCCRRSFLLFDIGFYTPCN